MTTLFRVFEEMDRVDDVFERYGVDEVLGDAGLSVHPDYRGLGIAIELLKARYCCLIKICENASVKFVWFRICSILIRIKGRCVKNRFLLVEWIYVLHFVF